MKGFGSEASYKQLYYMLENPKFTQRQMARDLNMYHGEKINSFVRWLESLRFVKKTFETSMGKPRYEVTSRVDLVNFYSRFRYMQKIKLDTVVIGTNKDAIIKYLSENDGIMCLTTALQQYGEEYFRDPEVHVYVETPKLLDELSQQTEGRVKVSI